MRCAEKNFVVVAAILGFATQLRFPTLIMNQLQDLSCGGAYHHGWPVRLRRHPQQLALYYSGCIFPAGAGFSSAPATADELLI